MALGFCCSAARRVPAPNQRPASRHRPSAGASGPGINPDEGWRAQKPGAGQPGKLDYPLAEHARLANGLALYVVRRPGGGRATLDREPARRRFGSAGQERARRADRAHAHRGHQNQDQPASSPRPQSRSARAWRTTRAATTRPWSFTTLREDLARGLELLAEVVKTPAFRKEELERVRGEWLDGLVAERQQPARIASLVGLRVLARQRLRRTRGRQRSRRETPDGPGPGRVSPPRVCSCEPRAGGRRRRHARGSAA